MNMTSRTRDGKATEESKLMTIDITEAAKEKITEVIGKSDEPIKGLRLGATPRSPLKADYSMALIKGEDGTKEDDVVIPKGAFNVFVDPTSAPYLDGAKIDYVENLMGGGFKVDSPPALIETLGGAIAAKIQKLLDEQINPSVGMHGGYVSLIDVKDNVAFIEMGGGCHGCGMANVTLREGVEVVIKENVPEITEIYDTTDHASGKNPYYAPAE